VSRSVEFSAAPVLGIKYLSKSNFYYTSGTESASKLSQNKKRNKSYQMQVEKT
jgi:hypothetical protein